MLTSYVESDCRGAQPTISVTSERQSADALRDLASRALLRAFLVEQIEGARGRTKKLGFAHVDYGRLFVRDQWTLFAIARELNCAVEDLLEPPQPAPESRVVWADVVDASEKIMACVRAMPEAVGRVTMLRASGMGWRKIGKALPGRALFSLSDDFVLGVDRVLRDHPREIRLLADSTHPKFIVVNRPK